MVAVLAALVALGARLRVAPAVRARRAVREGWAVARAYAATAPATFLYLLIVSVTAWVTATSPNHIADQLLVGHSSNLRALAAQPLKGLIQSAFWVDGGVMLAGAVVLAIALAPVERWLGTLRWIVVAATGHIVTTLLVALLISLAVDSGYADAGARSVVDVGVSYAFGAVAGVLTWRLAPRRRVPYVVVVLATLTLVLVVAPDFTAAGHIISVLVGLALVPITRGPGPLSRASGALYPRPRPTGR